MYSWGLTITSVRFGVSEFMNHSFSPELLVKESDLLRLHALGYTNTGLSKALDIGLVSVDRMLKNNGLTKHSWMLSFETGFKYSISQQLDMVRRFNECHSKRMVMHEFDLTFKAICLILDNHGVDHWGHHRSTDELTETQIVNAIRDYQSGTSQNEICRRLGINAAAFTSLFKERQIDIRGQLKHQVNSTYFDKIDTFYKAYFLGWLASDGSIGYTRGEVTDKASDAHVGRISLSIQERDCYIVEKLREEIGFSGEVKNIDKGPGRQRQCRLSFCDQRMARNLYSYGLTPNKSFTFRFPDIPERWMSAFILGYFDGDGCVTWANRPDKGRERATLRHSFSIISSVSFADRLFDILTKNGIKVFKVAENRKSAPLMHVKGASRESIPAFYHFIYRNAPLYLRRKKEKFEEIFRQLKEKDSR